MRSYNGIILAIQRVEQLVGDGAFDDDRVDADAGGTVVHRVRLGGVSRGAFDIRGRVDDRNHVTGTDTVIRCPAGLSQLDVAL